MVPGAPRVASFLSIALAGHLQQMALSVVINKTNCLFASKTFDSLAHLSSRCAESSERERTKWKVPNCYYCCEQRFGQGLVETM